MITTLQGHSFHPLHMHRLIDYVPGGTDFFSASIEGRSRRSVHDRNPSVLLPSVEESSWERRKDSFLNPIDSGPVDRNVLPSLPVGTLQGMRMMDFHAIFYVVFCAGVSHICSVGWEEGPDQEKLIQNHDPSEDVIFLLSFVEGW